MRRLRITRFFKLFLALVIAVASVQFASHSVRPEVTDPGFAHYLASGGSLADLCLDPNGKSAYGHSDCPFCREVEFVAVSPPITEVAPTVFAVRYAFSVTVADPAPPASTELPPTRAPPAA